MVSATFLNGRTSLKVGVDDAECYILAEELATLILAGSAITDTFQEITRQSANYSDYLPAIKKVIEGDFAGATGVSLQGLGFYKSLEAACRGYALKPSVWVDAVGLIVEFAFLILMRQKYAENSVDFYHEHRVEIISHGNTMNTERKSIDAIMWCPADGCGEFLEVKKDLDKKITPLREGNADKFVRKVAKMYDLLAFLEVHGSTTSIVGLATLSENPLALTLVELALRKSGKLSVGVVLQKSRQKVPHPLRGWGTLEGTYGKATENVVTRTQGTDRARRPAR